MIWAQRHTEAAARWVVKERLMKEKLLVMQVEEFLMGHERTEDGFSDGGSATTESDGHPED